MTLRDDNNGEQQTTEQHKREMQNTLRAASSE